MKINEEGNMTIESSIVFPFYIIFFILLLSTIIYVFNRENSKVNTLGKLSDKLSRSESFNEDDMVENNEIKFPLEKILDAFISINIERKSKEDNYAGSSKNTYELENNYSIKNDVAIADYIKEKMMIMTYDENKDEEKE